MYTYGVLRTRKTEHVKHWKTALILVVSCTVSLDIVFVTRLINYSDMQMFNFGNFVIFDSKHVARSNET